MLTSWPAVSVADPPRLAALPSITALTLTLLPADALNAAPDVMFSTGALTFTSRRALRSTRPVALSITPLTFTDPPLDEADSELPLIPRVVTSPPAVMLIGADPDTRAAPMFAAPPDAVMLIAPLLVAMPALTVTSRDAASVTAPPEAPPRPSIAALTAMPPPAVTVSALPLRGFRIGWLMCTSWPADRSTRPVLPSMRPLALSVPPLEEADNDPPLTVPSVRSPADRIAMAPLPESTPIPAATVWEPPDAVSVSAPLLVATHWLRLRFLAATSETAPPDAPPRPSTWALTLMSRPALTARALPVCAFRID